MNVAHALEARSETSPDRTALVFAGREWSYADLNTEANRVGHGLRAQGVRGGDHVCLLLPNGPEFVATYFALLKIGAVPVSLNVMLKQREIAFIANDARASALVAHASLWQNVPPRQEMPTVRLCVSAGGAAPDALPFERLLGASATLVAIEADADDTAAILYTSGTTGQPKGAMLTHGNVVCNVEAVTQYLDMVPDDRCLCFLPLFHCFGQNFIMNAALAAGATLFLQERFVPDVVLETIERERITLLYAVPTVYVMLLNHPSLAAHDLSSLRITFSAAASMPLEVAERWRERFGQPIIEGYGLTETSPFASFNGGPGFRAGTVGTAIRGVEINIVDAQDRHVPLGELGEIVIRGPNVMKGYFGRPQETAEALRGGWFHTGDVGRMDADGYVSIVDRVKDMINVGGFNVWPREVEEVLFEHPAVRECGVIGVPDPLYGETVKAYVVLREGALETTPDELITYCAERMAVYKVPREVEFIAALPKSPTGKILKRELRARLPASLPA
jgi:long-chain acyl-CoA synthetase